MNIQKRTLVLGSLTACFLAVYMMARYYSPVLVAHVVEESLIQKVPEGTNATLVRERFRRLIDPIAHREDRLKKLISVSAYLEKIQRLTPDELENLLRDPGVTLILWNFQHLEESKAKGFVHCRVELCEPR